MSEASVTTRSKLGGDGGTKYGGNRLIFLAVILTDIEDARTVNTNTHTNDETVTFADVISSDDEIDEGSNCDMEDSYFVVGGEYITYLHEEEYERSFMSKYWK